MANKNLFNTDILELARTWDERVAFNQGYEAQIRSNARKAGAESVDLGLSKQEGRDAYFARKEISSESEVADSVDDESSSPVDMSEIEAVADTSDEESVADMSDEESVADSSHHIEVKGLHESWDLYSGNDELRAQWIANDMYEAEYMNMWGDLSGESPSSWH